MPKLTNVEYTILKSLESKWKYVARDKSGTIYLYSSKPKMYSESYILSYGVNTTNIVDFNAFAHLFKFIKFGDEPTNIDEIIIAHHDKTKGGV